MKNYLLLGLIVLVVSCKTQSTSTVQNKEVVLSETLGKGRDLYANSCSNCHELFLPKKYTASEWNKNLNWMQERAKISDAEKQLIYDYLVSASK
jgi:cytochrome c5